MAIDVVGRAWNAGEGQLTPRKGKRRGGGQVTSWRLQRGRNKSVQQRKQAGEGHSLPMSSEGGRSRHSEKR
jgi:hypothetical protein